MRATVNGAGATFKITPRFIAVGLMTFGGNANSELRAVLHRLERIDNPFARAPLGTCWLFMEIANNNPDPPHHAMVRAPISLQIPGDIGTWK